MVLTDFVNVVHTTHVMRNCVGAERGLQYGTLTEHNINGQLWGRMLFSVSTRMVTFYPFSICPLKKPFKSGWKTKNTGMWDGQINWHNLHKIVLILILHSQQSNVDCESGYDRNIYLYCLNCV